MKEREVNLTLRNRALAACGKMHDNGMIIYTLVDGKENERSRICGSYKKIALCDDTRKLRGL